MKNEKATKLKKRNTETILCDDAIFEVFSFSEHKELAVFQMVCKSWKAMVDTRSNHYFQNIYRSMFAEIKKEDIKKIKEEFKTEIENNSFFWKELLKKRITCGTKELKFSRFMKDLTFDIVFDNDSIECREDNDWY